MQASASRVADLEKNIARYSLLDVEIPLLAVRGDITAIVELNRLSQQRCQAEARAGRAVEPAGIWIVPAHNGSDAVQTRHDAGSRLEARGPERTGTSAESAVARVKQAGACADRGFLCQAVSNAETRREIVAVGLGIVTGLAVHAHENKTAVHGDTWRLQRRGRTVIEIRELVEAVRARRLIFPADAPVHRQSRGQLPRILDEQYVIFRGQGERRGWIHAARPECRAENSRAPGRPPRSTSGRNVVSMASYLFSISYHMVSGEWPPTPTASGFRVVKRLCLAACCAWRPAS